MSGIYTITLRKNKRGCSADGRSEKPSALEHRLLFLLFVEYNLTSIYLSICLILFSALPPTKNGTARGATT